MTCAPAIVNVLFAADLFNEGLDLPDVDTDALPATHRERHRLPAAARAAAFDARRDEGRADGARLRRPSAPRSSVSIDGSARCTGANSAGLIDEIERGFPFLPAGCQIIMDRAVATDRAREHCGQLGHPRVA